MVRQNPKGSKAVKGKQTAKRDDPAQAERFIKAAREADADESEAGADRAFKQVAKGHKPKAKK